MLLAAVMGDKMVMAARKAGELGVVATVLEAMEAVRLGAAASGGVLPAAVA